MATFATHARFFGDFAFAPESIVSFKASTRAVETQPVAVTVIAARGDFARVTAVGIEAETLGASIRFWSVRLEATALVRSTAFEIILITGTSWNFTRYSSPF